MTTTFIPGPVMRAKHPATKQKAYFATLSALEVKGHKQLEPAFKRARDAEAFAEQTAKLMNQAQTDDQRGEVTA